MQRRFSALATVVMWRIVTSPFGLCLRTIRENPEKAASLGISVARYRWYAFLIAAVYAAVGGALLGPTIGQVDPGLVYWTQSGNLVFMTLLGGFTHFFGPLLGALVFIYLQDAVMSIVPYWRLIFGAILAVLVIFLPRGTHGTQALADRTLGEAGGESGDPMILQVHDLRKYYNAFCALDGVSFQRSRLVSFCPW